MKRCLQIDITGMGIKKRKRVNKVMRAIGFEQLISYAHKQSWTCIRMYMHRKQWSYSRLDAACIQDKIKTITVDEFLDRFGGGV